MHLLFLFISLGLVLSVPLDWQWEEWKVKHGKSYKDEAGENHRREVWMRNYHYILQHNRQDHLFKLGLNEFTDMVRKCQCCTCVHVDKVYELKAFMDNNSTILLACTT